MKPQYEHISKSVKIYKEVTMKLLSKYSQVNTGIDTN